MFTIDIIPQHSIRMENDSQLSCPTYEPGTKKPSNSSHTTTNSDIVYAYQILLNGEEINVTATYEQAYVVAESIRKILDNRVLLEAIGDFVLDY